MRIAACVLLFVVFPVFAVEPLASSALIQQCSSSDDVEVRVCQSWIHGFIGGAFASRTVQRTDPSQKETFSERAARTRIARGNTVYGRNVDVGYCLPPETTLDELVDVLIQHATVIKQMPDHANQLMLGVLRRHYPCK